jgi:hypothetical protein
MRTLIFIGICTVCVGIAVWECRDRENRAKMITQGLVGLVVGLVLWRFLIFLGIFDHW